MQKIKVLNSQAVPLPLENIDTDQIIPSRFLKAIDKHGFGENLFRDWAYDKKGNRNLNFVLNNESYKGKILITGKNFGCGSSREHAAWALKDYGFEVVVSSYFADIFKENALNNGILPIELEPKQLDFIFRCIEENASCNFRIDLEKQQFIINSKSEIFHFKIDAYKKECLLKGFSDLDFLISLKDEIKSFEATHSIY